MSDASESTLQQLDTANFLTVLYSCKTNFQISRRDVAEPPEEKEKEKEGNEAEAAEAAEKPMETEDPATVATVGVLVTGDQPTTN